MEPVTMNFYSYTPECSESSRLSPIILIHGLFSTNSTWNKVKLSIADRTKRKIYAVDLRNHGQSEWSEDFSLRDLVSDLEALMRGERVGTAVLVGHSVGGRLAMAMALKNPDMIEKLVVEDISIRDVNNQTYDNGLMAVKFMMRTLATFSPSLSEIEANKKMNEVICKFFPKLSSTTARNPGNGTMLPFHKTSSGKFVVDCNSDVIAKTLEDKRNLRVDLTNSPIFKGNTFFIFGEHSEFPFEEDKPRCLRHFPNASFKMIEKGFHVLHVEMPARFAQEVAHFINGT